MRLYLESNFILELALEQENAAEADQILSFSEEGKVDIVFPTFAICEPFSTVSLRTRNRQRLVNELSRESQDLQRSWLHTKLTLDVGSVVSQLAAVEQSERNRLESTVARVLRLSRSIELTELVFAEALLLERRHSLSPQDAIVLASVLEDLKQNPVDSAVFASENWKDFNDPDIISNLSQWRCAFADSFHAAIHLLGLSP